MLSTVPTHLLCTDDLSPCSCSCFRVVNGKDIFGCHQSTLNLRYGAYPWAYSMTILWLSWPMETDLCLLCVDLRQKNTYYLFFSSHRPPLSRSTGSWIQDFILPFSVVIFSELMSFCAPSRSLKLSLCKIRRSKAAGFDLSYRPTSNQLPYTSMSVKDISLVSFTPMLLLWAQWHGKPQEIKKTVRTYKWLIIVIWEKLMCKITSLPIYWQ